MTETIPALWSDQNHESPPRRLMDLDLVLPSRDLACDMNRSAGITLSCKTGDPGDVVLSAGGQAQKPWGLLRRPGLGTSR